MINQLDQIRGKLAGVSQYTSPEDHRTVNTNFLRETFQHPAALAEHLQSLYPYEERGSVVHKQAEDMLSGKADPLLTHLIAVSAGHQPNTPAPPAVPLNTAQEPQPAQGAPATPGTLNTLKDKIPPL